MIQNLLNVPTQSAATSTSGASGSNSTSTTTSSTSSTSGVDGLANEQTFLQLFVAQLQNQDPDTPQDPAQFVSQLAQFSDLEQTLQMRQDLDAILQLQTASAASASSTTSS